MMRAKIVIGWGSALLKNQAYRGGDVRQGHTDACVKAMWDIKMLLTSVAHSFKPAPPRIQVVITAYRPSGNIDAQNLIDAVSDAVELGINVNDKDFDVSAIGELDLDRPRIEIAITQED